MSAMVKEFMEKYGQPMAAVPTAPVAVDVWLSDELVKVLEHSLHKLVRVQETFANHAKLHPEEPKAAGRATTMLRARLIVEEAVETAAALLRGDLVEVADGLADLRYVTYGTELTYGIPGDAVLAEVHASNMSKAPLGVDGKGGKVGKGAAYFKPDVAGALRGASGPQPIG